MQRSLSSGVRAQVRRLLLETAPSSMGTTAEGSARAVRSSRPMIRCVDSCEVKGPALFRAKAGPDGLEQLRLSYPWMALASCCISSTKALGVEDVILVAWRRSLKAI